MMYEFGFPTSGGKKNIQAGKELEEIKWKQEASGYKEY